jgi:peptide deformylase
MRVVARGFNMHGDPIRVEGSELLARAIQHETDHLDGIVFIDRLTTADRKLAMKEIRESEWFGSAIANGTSPVIKVSPHFTNGLGN